MKRRYVIFLCILIAALLFGTGFHVGKRSVCPIADTIRLGDTVRLPAPEVIREIPVPVPVDVDTAAILQKYFTKKVYNDTIILTKFIDG